MRMILSSHKITYAPSQGGVVTVSTTHKNIMPEFRMLAFKSMQGGALFESFLLSPFPYFEKYSNNKYFKTVQKVVPNIFEINLRIN